MRNERHPERERKRTSGTVLRLQLQMTRPRASHVPFFPTNHTLEIITVDYTPFCYAIISLAVDDIFLLFGVFLVLREKKDSIKSVNDIHRTAVNCMRSSADTSRLSATLVIAPS